MSTFQGLLTCIGAAMMVGGLAAAGGHPEAGMIAGVGAALLTAGVLEMVAAARVDKENTKAEQNEEEGEK